MARQPVGLEFFAGVHAPFGLGANGAGALCFGVRRGNIPKNRYDKSLWLWRAGKPRRLKAPADFSGHWWLGDDTLLLAGPGGAKQKRWAVAGLGYTRLQTLPLEGGEGRCLLEVNLAVQEVLPLGGGRLLLLAGWDPVAAEALEKAKNDMDKAAALLGRQAGCRVLEELPFWQNGGGITSGKRGRLYVWDGKALAALTDEETDVDMVRLAPGGRAALYIAKRYRAVAPVEDELFCIDLETMKTRNVTFAEGFRHRAVVPLKGEAALVAGSDGLLYGINQNPAFYRLDLVKGRVTLLNDAGRYSGWQSVGSDVAMAAESRWFAKGDTVYWVSTVGHSSQLMAMDAQSGEITQLTRQEGAVLEACEGAGQLYFTALRGLAAPEIYRLEPNGDESRLSRLNTRLEETYTLARPRAVAFTNSRGSGIEGWVLKPPGLKKGERCPAILSIHGGPKTVYGPVLHHEMQYWAAQGFAVLFCNPTGSDGGGDEFADIRGAYGGIDCEDILAFTDAALAQNREIDPGRVGVAGGSYGGFMVNWLIGHTHRFGAAVSQRGISNWGSMALLSDIGYYFEPDQVGCSLWQNPEAVWDASPLKYARQVKTPTLFIHAEEDYRCPLAEGLQMYTVLQLAGVDTRFCLFQGENHELSRSGRPQNRLRRLDEITRWMKRYLCAGAEGVAGDGDG